MSWRITESFYNKKLIEYRAEQSNIQTKLKNLQEADSNYYTTAVYLLNLANKAPALFKRSEPDIKRQIIKLVLQNCVINDISLYATYRSPFSIFAERASCHNWLPLYDAFRNRDIELEIDLSSIKQLMEEANLILA